MDFGRFWLDVLVVMDGLGNRLDNIISFVRAHRVFHIQTILGIRLNDVIFQSILRTLNSRRKSLIIFGQLIVLELKRVLLRPLAHPDRRK